MDYVSQSFVTKEVIQVDGPIYRSRRPSGFTDYLALKNELGIKTVINLRSGLDPVFEMLASESDLARKFEMKVIDLSLSAVLPPSVEELERVIRLMLDPKNHPVLIHCRDGADLTGFITAAYYMRCCGLSFYAAVRNMREMGFSYSRYFWWLFRLQTFRARALKAV